MEVNGRLLTEAESAELAGVSPETIRQYGEFGLLMPVEKDGQLFFQEAEIRTLFYTKAPTPPKDRPENGHSFTLRAFDIHAEPQTRGTGRQTEREDTRQNPPPFAQAAQTALDDTSLSQNSAQPSAQEPQPQLETVDSPLQAPQQPTPPASAAAAELAELNKSLRDQIQVLKDERDWLRERIEKLEARSEREQMLLMSESETVRNLIRKGDQRPRSFWNFALPWFGLTESTNNRR